MQLDQARHTTMYQLAAIPSYEPAAVSQGHCVVT